MYINLRCPPFLNLYSSQGTYDTPPHFPTSFASDNSQTRSIPTISYHLSAIHRTIYYRLSRLSLAIYLPYMTPSTSLFIVISLGDGFTPFSWCPASVSTCFRQRSKDESRTAYKVKAKYSRFVPAAPLHPHPPTPLNWGEPL